jgi:hypothetical protein
VRGRTARAWTATAAIAATWIALPAGAQAQALDDRFWAEASLYWPAVDTDIRADNLATANPGTEIDFESDLDLSDRKTLPAVLVGARLGSGFSIVGEYFRVKRSNSATIDREIVIDDVTYPVDAVLDASFASDVYRLSIGWAFARGENYEAGAVLGLHATDFEVSLAGQGSVNGQPLSNEVRRKDVLAPLPTLGVFGSWEVMEDLTLNGRFDFMSLGIDDFDGRLINVQANLVYRVFDNVGIGVGYRYVDYRVDVDNEDWIGRADYAFNGPHVLLQVGFR